MGEYIATAITSAAAGPMWTQMPSSAVLKKKAWCEQTLNHLAEMDKSRREITRKTQTL